MRVCTVLFLPLACLLLCVFAAESSAGDNNGSGTFPELRALANTAQDMNKRLTHMESLLETLVRPVWEYKVVVPNMMNTSNMGDQILDGIDLDKLGKDGWELISYTANYGFIFKRRRMDR